LLLCMKEDFRLNVCNTDLHSSIGDASDASFVAAPPLHQPRPSVDTEELTRFRDQWKKELKPTDDDILQSSSLPKQSTSAVQKPPVTAAAAGGSLVVALSVSADDQPNDSESDEEPLNLIERILRLVHVTEPQIPTSSIHVSNVPPEVLLRIFRQLEVRELEMCSRVSRQWLCLTRDHSLWKQHCLRTWKSFDTAQFAVFGRNWRRCYVERPRLRFEGIYICKDSYLRAGQTEGVFYQPVHKVTFYRYLRFYSDSSVLYYIGPEEPKEVAEWLKHERKQRAFSSGSFYFEDDRVIATICGVGSGTFRLVYRLQLEIQSTTIGKHNRLKLCEYETGMEHSHERNYFHDTDLINIKFNYARLPPHLL